MRRRLTYANVAATLALVFSMTGGAIAAHHYLINSTKQINPKVLKKLRGATGKTGSRGAAGPAGSSGAAGAAGAPGPSNVFSSFHDPPITLESLSGQQTFSSLPNLPAGAFWLVATFDAVNGTAATVDLACELHAGSNVDLKRFRLQPTGPASANNMAATLQTVAALGAGGGAATLSCNTFGVKPVEIEHIRITAVLSGSLTNNGV
jgi:hypothetical protein